MKAQHNINLCCTTSQRQIARECLRWFVYARSVRLKYSAAIYIQTLVNKSAHLPSTLQFRYLLIQALIFTTLFQKGMLQILHLRSSSTCSVLEYTRTRSIAHESSQVPKLLADGFESIQLGGALVARSLRRWPYLRRPTVHSTSRQ